MYAMWVRLVGTAMVGLVSCGNLFFFVTGNASVQVDPLPMLSVLDPDEYCMFRSHNGSILY
jgi:hypothetical protein